MIDEASIEAWGQVAPWLNQTFIEQDLIISRALIHVFNHPILTEKLVFRGGTALQKLFYKNNPTRYSEDIDMVQIHAGPIGPILDGLKEVLEPWLGKPKKKIGEGRATLIYKYQSSIHNELGMKLKVEINTREHFSVFDVIKIPFAVKSPWFTGHADIVTYSLEELLGSKFRALYQRKKGRDLYDLAIAIRQLPLDLDRLLICYNKYMEYLEVQVSRAEFEKNLLQKKTLPSFQEDILPLLAVGNNMHSFDDDFTLVMEQLVAKLPGEPWKGIT
jgi:predicted nucleotidyltransferase component of viral defense system